MLRPRSVLPSGYRYTYIRKPHAAVAISKSHVPFAPVLHPSLIAIQNWRQISKEAASYTALGCVTQDIKMRANLFSLPCFTGPPLYSPNRSFALESIARDFLTSLLRHMHEHTTSVFRFQVWDVGKGIPYLVMVWLRETESVMYAQLYPIPVISEKSN